MTDKEFKDQYICSCEVNERQAELERRVSDYFELSDSDASNSVVIPAKMELLEWVKASGYTRDEYLSARRHCQSNGNRMKR